MSIFNLSGPADILENAFEGENTLLRYSNDELQTDLGVTMQEVRELQESLLDISDRFDNMNWSPLDDADAGSENELKLETVHKVAKLARAMTMMNPFVKRGVQARISYIWGKGVAFDGVETVGRELEMNRKKLFSGQAYEELERALATDGNVFTALAVEKGEKRAFRVPLSEIMGAVSAKDDSERIVMYKRVWHETTTTSSGHTKKTEKVEYIPSIDYYYERQDQGKNMHRTWRGEKVNQEFVIHHLAVNKQVGWKWGLPDVMPVIFWAKAYKEYLEDNALLVKAYSRLAWQYRSANKTGAQAAASSIRRAPTRDPLTGDLRDIGGAAVTGMGQEITSLPATGSSVDFEKGSALAAAIASGLEVSKVVITSDPGAGNRSAAETLDGPTRKAMETRQQLHIERMLDILEFWGLKVSELGTARPVVKPAEEAAGKNTNSGRDYVTVTFPSIDSDSTKDRIAALGTAVELGIIFKEEARKEVLDVFDISPFKPWDELPEEEEPPAVSGEFGNTEPSVIAKQGGSGGVSAANGAQGVANAARDNRTKDEGK